MGFQKEKINEDPPTASFRDMFRYATFWDYVILGFAIFCSLCAGVCFPLVCVIMQKVHASIIQAQTAFDAGKGSEMIDSLVETVIEQCIYVAINGIIMFIFGYISMLSFYILCERQMDKMRKEFFLKVLNQDMEWFDNTDPGTLIQNMASGFERIRDGMSDKIGLLILATSSLAIGTIYAFYIHWKLALVLVAVTPVIVLSLFLSIRTIITAGKNQQKQYSAAGAIAYEVISAIRTVIAFNGQYFEIERYRKCLEIAKKIGIKKGIATGFYTGLYITVLYSSVGLAFWYGTRLAIAGDIQPGVVLAVFQAVIYGALQIGQALPSLGAITNAKIAAGQILDIIDKKPKMLPSKTRLRLTSLTGQVMFENVHFSYPTRPTVPVLEGISLTVSPGEKIALVGYSGSGKSTVLNLLMKFYKPSQGQIKVDDYDIESLDTNWLRSSIGYVSQDPVIFSATVERNLRMGNELASEEEIIKACKLANAHYFIEKLPNGYDTVIGEGGVGLSGGQKQRISIARAIVKDPKILLLDEATSALDSESEALVQEALNNCSSGRTMITVAHRLSTIWNADRILVFHAGQIVEQGTHEELMRLNKNYHQLVLAQKLNQNEESQEEKNEENSDEDDLKRANLRFSRSLSNVKRTDPTADMEDKTEELEKEGAQRANLSQIFRYCRPEMKLIISGIVMSFVRGLQWPLFAILVGQILLLLSYEDPVLAAAASNRTSLSFIVVGVFGGLATLISGSLLGASGEKMAARLRLAVFRNILRQDGYYFDQAKHSVEKLTTRLGTDAHNVQAAVDQRLSEVLQGVTSLVTGVAYAFYISPTVAPICLLSNIVLALFQIGIGGYLKKRGQSDSKLAEPASQIAGESIANAKTVQSLVQQLTVFKAFCEASAEPYKRAILRGFFQSLIFAIAISFTCFNFALTYYTGILMIQAGYTTPYLLFQVIESLHMGAILIIAAANYFPEYLKARLSGGLMFTMMNQEPKIDSLSEGGIRHDIHGTIKLEKLKFCYPNAKRHFALNGFNLTAYRGQTVAIVGSSGSGKSTAVQLIERYYEPFSGSILIDNIDISTMNLQHLRSQIALVGQDPFLFNLSIRENITYALPGATQDDVEAAAKFANIHNFVKSLPEEYDTRIGSKGTQLSGGQKQRLAIARAVIRQPKILLLDEATSALDSENEQLVQEALDRFRVGRTCITIAHRLSTVQSADCIIVMKDGKLVESGSHQSLLLDDGFYASFVKKQSLT